MKEILSLFIGQAGVQIGSSLWELFCAEHHVLYDGNMVDNKSDNECIDSLFQKVSSNKWVPRSLFIDLEPNVIDEIRSGRFRNLFHPDRLLSGPEDASNNFSRGFFTVGKLLLGSINEQCRHLFEQCEMAQGMMILRSLGGGTGAGLTSAMFEGLSEYPKTPKIEIPIYPSPTLSTSMVEPYNCLLSEHFCMEDIDIGLLLDNEALFEVCSKYLSISYPTYNTINRLIAQVISSITASVRFTNILNCDLTVLQTNLVPYPRIHFPLCNFAPMVNQIRADHQELSVQELTRLVFDRDNQMMKVDHFYGKFMSCALFYRGNICPHNVYLALSEIKRDHSIQFVDWCPTGFKVGINSISPVIIPESKLAETKMNVTMLTNSSAIGQAWQRLTHRFYLLYSKRSFVHWFIGEGMEECEFTEALYNISALVKDYEEAGENTVQENNETTKPPEEEIPLTTNKQQVALNEIELNIDNIIGVSSSNSIENFKSKLCNQNPILNNLQKNISHFNTSFQKKSDLFNEIPLKNNNQNYSLLKSESSCKNNYKHINTVVKSKCSAENQINEQLHTNIDKIDIKSDMMKSIRINSNLNYEILKNISDNLSTIDETENFPESFNCRNVQEIFQLDKDNNSNNSFTLLSTEIETDKQFGKLNRVDNNNTVLIKNRNYDFINFNTKKSGDYRLKKSELKYTLLKQTPIFEIKKPSDSSVEHAENYLKTLYSNQNSSFDSNGFSERFN